MIGEISQECYRKWEEGKDRTFKKMNTKAEGKVECWGDDQEISEPKRAQSDE